MKTIIFNNAQHREYLNMVDRIGAHWSNLFRDTPNANTSIYWDLLAALWRREKPLKWMDAAKLIRAVKSDATASKFIQMAIDDGLIQELDNPEDRRSKLVMLTPKTREQLDAFLDMAVGEVRRTNRLIDVKASSQSKS